jgi:hypothetical protein
VNVLKGLGRVAAPAVALVLLAGCSSGGDDDSSSGESSSATPSESSPSQTTSSDYLEVPDEVDLTPPGTELGFGDPATIAWEPRADETAILTVTVRRVDRTTFKQSFQGWVISEEMEGQTPLFVQATVSNAGDKRLGGEEIPLTVVDDTGIHVQPTIAQDQTFEPCPGGTLPKKFKPGAKIQVCLLYLLDPGREFTSVAFQPVDADHRPVADAISWTGSLTPLGAGDGGKGDKGTKGQ